MYRKGKNKWQRFDKKKEKTLTRNDPQTGPVKTSD
jgi:hypothetical protein